jgi:glycerol-3-phosphate acyltransferase PlsY
LNVYTLGALALGYLLGSIPFGLLLTSAAGLGDVRAIGSGNIGATNVLRTGHKGLAALTLLLDGLKGTAAVLIGYQLGALGGVAILASYMAGLGAFLGHVFPVWLNFRGGKGVATYIGVLLGVSWPLGLAFIAIWIVVALLTRYSSLSALVAALVVPIGALATGDRATALLSAILTALLIYKHRANIRRLASGEEPKIGARA